MRAGVTCRRKCALSPISWASDSPRRPGRSLRHHTAIASDGLSLRFMPRKTAKRAAARGPLTAQALRAIDAYWRAANYLSVGQIYLFANPLLRKPLERAHIKPRLLGHWGTTPGLNFIYAHLNRVIVENDLDMIYLAGPGHGGPALVANAYLEGTYTEYYHAITQ